MPPISVTFENGVFKPLEPVSLPEGSRAEVRVVEQDASDSTALSGIDPTPSISIEDQLTALAHTVSPDAWTSLPKDLTDR